MALRPDAHSIFDHEIEYVPKRLRKFLFRERPPSVLEQTWGYYHHGYSNGFDALYEAIIARRARYRHYLALPLFFIARHSVELAIKEASVAFAAGSSSVPELDSHRLMPLWNQLLRLIKASGIEVDDEW